MLPLGKGVVEKSLAMPKGGGRHNKFWDSLYVVA